MRNTRVSAYSADGLEGAARANPEDEHYVQFTASRSWLLFRDIDLNQIKKMTLSIIPGNTIGKLQIITGSSDGKLLAESGMLTKDSRPASGSQEGWFNASFTIPATDYFGDLHFVYVTDEPISIWGTFNLNTLNFEK